MKNLHILFSLFLPSLFLFSGSLSLVLSISPSHAHLQSQCLDDQRFALLQLERNLYYAPNFTFTSKAKLWDLNSDCCSWKGIACDPLGHVIGLDLNNKNLSGSFHSIFNLHHLQGLNLAGNNFNTTLFQYQFDRLPNLAHLNLSNSCFHGQIPMEISYLTRLVSLDLSNQDSCYKRYQQILDPYNGIYYYHYDPLPFELQQPLKLENPNFKTLIKNLRPLKELYLDSVNISTQSTEWCETISLVLPNLHVLSLSYCGLIGPFCASLSRLPFLSKLFLDRNSISYLPSNFLEISSRLVSLNLVDCNLGGHFPIEILLLPKIQSIDISSNYDLGGQLPEFPLNSALRILSISFTNFNGTLPKSIGNLKFLTNLDLSFCKFYGQIPPSIANLTNLVQLNLASNNFSGVIPAFHRTGVPNLAHLYLSRNGLSGSIHSSLFTLPSLQTLNLYGNQLVGEIEEFPNASSSLIKFLALGGNYLRGSIPKSILQLPRLESLYLEDIYFDSLKLDMFSQLKNLRDLDLSNTSLSIGSYNKSLPFPQLEFLSLRSCRPTELKNLRLDMFSQLKNLRCLDLSNTSLSIGSYNKSLPFPQLEFLSLRSCKLTEFPKFIKTQDKLVSLDLSNNQIHGFVPNCLWKTTLLWLDLSFNTIDFPKQFTFGNANSSFPMLKIFFLKSCNLSMFPEFLKRQENLRTLDLSNNKISGVVPNWVWKKSLLDLDLSKNSLSSLDQFSLNQSLNSSQGSLSRPICNLSQLGQFNASYNKLDGPIPNCLGNISTLYSLDLQNNNFSGSIPDFEKATQLDTLQLSDNKLEGKLPRSLAKCRWLQILNIGNNTLYDTFPLWLENLSYLTVLILQSNRFYGPIKSGKNNFLSLDVLDIAFNNFSGQLPVEFFQASQLRSLKMAGNKLEGKLPMSLANCKKLEVLDLGKNMIHDTFPIWLVKLPSLKVLVLRENRFYGSIKFFGNGNAFPMLRILDLASNGFSGELFGEFFLCLRAMTVLIDEKKANPKYIGDMYYQDKVTIVNKGLEMVLEKILTTYTCLDLSNNNFHGIIPEEIQNLTSLVVLNLSRNSFSGQIPISLDNVRELESLDLSKNKLSGKIPPQLVGLSFIAALNLSYNQLEGSIPQSNQFGTFSNDSYRGNPGLCGPPLTKKCNEADVPMPPTENDVDSQVDGISLWKIVLIGYGSGLVIGLSIGYTVLDEMGNKLLQSYLRKRKRNRRRSR